MRWEKLGLIFSSKHHPWMNSHASNPVAEHVAGNVFRIYFSCRDVDNRSSIGFIEIDIEEPHKILRVSDRPVIGPGARGLFDDSGASLGWMVEVSGKRYLYYVGWNLSVTVPWRNSIGLAISEAGEESFRKYSLAPILDRNEMDPYSLSYPCVIKDGSKWMMWYGSNLSWGKQEKEFVHVFKSAHSADGVHWEGNDEVVFPLNGPLEYAVSRPCVLKVGETYHLWYSYRGDSYRIGYAISEDSKNWTRLDDEVGIGVSDSGWDSEMIEYPFVFKHGDRYFMLYNGNGFGKSGVGLAVLSEGQLL